MNKSFEGPVDALSNWRFSMRLTRLLARRSLAVTPNHVTIAAIAVGLAAAWLASRGGHALFALAGVLLELNSILDSCDGELARLRFQYSRLGQWLDNLADDVVDNVFLIAVGAAIAVIPELPLIRVLLVTQVINGLLLPVILIAVLRLVNDREVMGDHVNRPIYNAGAWLTTVVVTLLSILLIVVTLFPGVLHWHL